ncbi:S-layer homology domain-containing protein [Anaerosinus sp.]|uniref:S-layer homology domain-containing protein n=1 Tax=Selenobaculum sp. TaxID=3074374 RepID=UPI0015A9084B
MKKTLAAAITSALVIGVAGTTFAAANPFSDVKADHWSFDAVAKLAQEGVIEGYGDNSFRGDSHITRYEMAQMVAKAMAKEDKVNKQQKAMIDKLAAEYAAELDNLGVRVANLESKIDNVTWNGQLRLRTQKWNEENSDAATQSQVYYDLNLSAKINDTWTGHVELEGERVMNGMEFNPMADDDGYATSNVYVQGPLLGADAKIGKFDSWGAQGYVLDDAMRGMELNYTSDKLDTTVRFGRVNGGHDDYYTWAKDRGPVYDSVNDENNSLNQLSEPANYAALELAYRTSDATTLQLGYHHLTSVNKFANANFAGMTDETNDIFTAGFQTKLTDDLKLEAIYAKSSTDSANGTTGKYSYAYDDNDGYAAFLRYKGTNVAEKGSYGIWAGYFELPISTVISSTYYLGHSYKALEVGVGYVPAENVVAKVYYWDAKGIGDTPDADMYRAQVQFFF